MNARTAKSDPRANARTSALALLLVLVSPSSAVGTRVQDTAAGEGGQTLTCTDHPAAKARSPAAAGLSADKRSTYEHACERGSYALGSLLAAELLSGEILTELRIDVDSFGEGFRDAAAGSSYPRIEEGEQMKAVRRYLREHRKAMGINRYDELLTLLNGPCPGHLKTNEAVEGIAVFSFPDESDYVDRAHEAISAATGTARRAPDDRPLGGNDELHDDSEITVSYRRLRPIGADQAVPDGSVAVSGCANDDERLFAEQWATKTFRFAGTIKGWRQALLDKNVRSGKMVRVLIRDDLAYGEDGAGTAVAAHEPLIYELVLQGVK